MSLIKELQQLCQTERLVHALMSYNSSLISRIKEALSQKKDLIMANQDLLRSDAILGRIMELENDNVNFLLALYHKTRLDKVFLSYSFI